MGVELESDIWVQDESTGRWGERLNEERGWDNTEVHLKEKG
jgi:hypothetical protein